MTGELFSYFPICHRNIPVNYRKLPSIVRLGILISERFILTAAHCVVRDDRKLPSIVRLGKIDLLGDSDNATAQDIPVEERIIHPEYKSYKLGKDIALLRLARTAEFNDNVKAVCLNTSPQIRSRLLISGWGLINRTTEQRSRFLQRAIMEPYDLNKCNQTFLESPSRIAIYDAQLCALSNAPAPSSTCKGDSGGPIQFENRRNDGRTPMIVAGITSYGRGCRGSVPTIYTRVSSYLSWIEEIVWR
ncbi:Trypsin [Popillia japonica]|uniref:Trypsin n=1 Tax=Popillia japonica TaxID=7064 RepID=A0AAW1KGQ7_POPJA